MNRTSCANSSSKLSRRSSRLRWRHTLVASRYERTPQRQGYRNGYKPRQLQTRVGTLELLVPQDRDGSFSTELFGRYQRSEQALVLTLMEMYLQGVSTRKVATVTEQLCGTRFSKSQVSTLTVQLDARLQTWRERPLTANAYPYLTVDARYEKVRQGGQVVSEGVPAGECGARRWFPRAGRCRCGSHRERGHLSGALSQPQGPGLERCQAGDQ